MTKKVEAIINCLKAKESYFTMSIFDINNQFEQQMKQTTAIAVVCFIMRFLGYHFYTRAYEKTTQSSKYSELLNAIVGRQALQLSKVPHYFYISDNI